MTRRHESSGYSPTSASGPPTPALLTAMRSGPSSPAAATQRSANSWSVTSPTRLAAVPPAAWISSTTAFTLTSLMSVRRTAAPLAASRHAIARPIPEPAPVTIAERPPTSYVAMYPDSQFRSAGARQLPGTSRTVGPPGGAAPAVRPFQRGRSSLTSLGGAALRELIRPVHDLVGVRPGERLEDGAAYVLGRDGTSGKTAKPATLRPGLRPEGVAPLGSPAHVGRRGRHTPRHGDPA